MHSPGTDDDGPKRHGDQPHAEAPVSAAAPAPAAASADDDDDFFIPADVFEEPAGFRPPSPQPSSTTFSREPSSVQPGTPKDFVVHLVAKHSLWAHWLWNAGKSMTNFLDKHKDMVAGKDVLELGAAAALPSIIAALNGARKVVSTDYPDPPLLNNIRLNAIENAPAYLENGTIVVEVRRIAI
ncbi:Protein N-terminal and lysine N-methyltransferase efm7 [Polyrhizophydium stewartii]|uniref:Protein N-terminal and lysine N-methyltransferase efm7 n=1 Tax=Polyrhizophydium stewartii TaxID=2732419 RepID=A0ABR4NK33_9FUNG|nr:nicotinamide n-methyltransferase [Polyrhizophydium stewartii]